jgi:hypothetical protein
MLDGELLTPARWLAKQKAAQAEEIRELAHTARAALTQWTIEEPDAPRTDGMTAATVSLVNAVGELLDALGCPNPFLPQENS